MTAYYSHMISESVVRDKWPLDSMSEISCYGDILPHPRIEQVTPWFHALFFELIKQTQTLHPVKINGFTIIDVDCVFNLRFVKLFILVFEEYKFLSNFTKYFSNITHPSSKVPIAFLTTLQKTIRFFNLSWINLELKNDSIANQTTMFCMHNNLSGPYVYVVFL